MAGARGTVHTTSRPRVLVTRSAERPLRATKVAIPTQQYTTQTHKHTNTHNGPSRLSQNAYFRCGGPVLSVCLTGPTTPSCARTNQVPNLVQHEALAQQRHPNHLRTWTPLMHSPAEQEGGRGAREACKQWPQHKASIAHNKSRDKQRLTPTHKRLGHVHAHYEPLRAAQQGACTQHTTRTTPRTQG